MARSRHAILVGPPTGPLSFGGLSLDRFGTLQRRCPVAWFSGRIHVSAAPHALLLPLAGPPVDEPALVVAVLQRAMGLSRLGVALCEWFSPGPQGRSRRGGRVKWGPRRLRPPSPRS